MEERQLGANGICVCGHTGDGALSDHWSDMTGLGPCRVCRRLHKPGCSHYEFAKPISFFRSSTRMSDPPELHPVEAVAETGAYPHVIPGCDRPHEQ